MLLRHISAIKFGVWDGHGTRRREQLSR